MGASGTTERRARRAASAVLAAAVAGCNLGAAPAVFEVTGAGNDVSDLAAGDLDGDGHVDIFAAVNGGYGVALGDGTGGFEITRVTTPPAPGWHVDLGDVDLDGRTDLVYVAGQPTGDPPRVEIRLGDGGGGFAATPMVLPSLHAAREVAAGDVDGDGDLDVVAITVAGADVWRNQGGGTFAPPYAVGTGTNPSDVVLADLDADGALDLVTAGFDRAAAVGIALGDGGGGFGPAATYPLPVAELWGTTLVRVADLDGNGTVDVYGGNTTLDRVFAFPGDGSGGLAPALLSPVGTAGVQDLAAADLDGDGVLDLATGGSEVLFGAGDGTFPESHDVDGGRDVVTADLDGNGQPDLAYALDENLKVLLNHLDGRRDHD